MKIKQRQIKWKKRGSCPTLVKLCSYFFTCYLQATSNAPYEEKESSPIKESNKNNKFIITLALYNHHLLNEVTNIINS
jgi:hypothetical protein